MRKTLLVLPFLLLLGGCAGVTKLLDSSGTSLLQGGLSLTAPVDQITPRMTDDIENVAKVGVAGLVGYRRLCIRGTIDRSCRATIVEIQQYTRPLCSEFNKLTKKCSVGVLADLRRFVAQNDQVNALKAFNLARQLITGIQSMRAAKGI